MSEEETEPVLDNPGAAIVVTNHPSFSAAFAGREYVPHLTTCSLRTDVAPEFSCETETWNPTGGIRAHDARPDLAASVEWMLTDNRELSEAEVQTAVTEVRGIQERITELVLDSSNETGWYFGRHRGHWWLLAIDVVTPCSA